MDSLFDSASDEVDSHTTTTTSTRSQPRNGLLEHDGLYSDQVDEADIRKMAAALAPQLSELEDVLKDISANEDEMSMNALELAETATRSMREEDDDLDDELQQLAMSEEALREELEFAQDMTAMFSPSRDEGEYDENGVSFLSMPSDEPSVFVTPTKASKPVIEEIDPPAPIAYTLQDHADYLRVSTEKVGGWYYCDMSQFLQASTEAVSTDLVKEYCLPIPFRKLKRLYSGLMYHQVLPAKAVAVTPSKAPRTPSTPAPGLTPGTPVRKLVLSAIGVLATPSTPATPSMIPPPPPPSTPHEEPLPVRTITIRIRPDVLCGAVMDAIHHAFEILPSTCTSHVLKRQGGHLRGGVYLADKAMAYVMDAQLCTQKNDELERRLIIRFYHVQDDPEAMNELGQALQQKVPPSPGLEPPGSFNELDDKNIANRHMKQSCSLIQRLMAAQQQGGASSMDAKQQSSWLGVRDMAFKTKGGMQKAIGSHLESNFKICPSVREENKKATPTIRRLTLPSLSAKDWALLEVSWALTNSVMEELDTRDCTYNTIDTLPFGQFPSLPTLDVHYCSQLRRLSRESMITHLLKSAKDLEDYAKGAEYNCAVCMTLLEPMLSHYSIPPLDIPSMAKRLQDYPLEYTPPQVACPPWGNLVMEALNKVTAKTTTRHIDVSSAIKMVYDAFIRQDDEEQAARLGRKNAQIMERLAALQARQRSLVQNIRDAHVYSEQAGKDAAMFLRRAQKALNAGREGFPRVLEPQVPLLSFRISLGASSSGTCYLSTTQMMFVTTFIPLLGGTRFMLFDLEQVTFQVDEGTPSTLLNPFPNTMRILARASNHVLYSFRSSVSPTRLHTFLKVLQSFAGEERPSEFSEVVDNMNVVEEDGVVRLSETQSEDQLSI